MNALPKSDRTLVSFRASRAFRRLALILLGFALSLCVAGTAAENAACHSPPAGLAGWWPFEGDGSDESGQHPALLLGNAAFGGGMVGQALAFDGHDDFAKVAASPELDVGAGPGLTIEGWIKPANVAAIGTLVEWNNHAGSIGAHFHISVPVVGGGGPGALYANLVDTGRVSHQIWTAPGLLTPNVFQHVALTYDKASGVAMLYLNGSVRAETNLGSFTPQTSYDLYLGVRPSGPVSGTYFAGMLDEISLYAQALGPAELSALCAAGSAGKCRVERPPIILTQPANARVYVGGTVTLGVVAGGTAPLSYQWQRADTALPGATNPVLSLVSVQAADAGDYSVVVNNAAGSVTSQVATLTVDPVPPCAGTPPGLVAWWPLDGSGEDWLGRSAWAFSGNPTFGPGQVDGSLQFDGANDCGRTPASPDLDVGTGEGLTIELWIKPSDAGAMGTLVEWNNGAGSIGAHFCVSVPSAVSGAGSLFANLVDTGGTSHQIGSAGGLLRANQDQHAAVTYDKASGEATLYLDGNQVSQTNLGVFTPQTSFDLYLGVRPSGPISGTYFAGQMDEVGVYGRALGAAELAALYVAGPAGKCREAFAPGIVTQPRDSVVYEGETATFSVGANGTAPLSYQWVHEGSALPGGSNATLVLANPQASDVGDYWVVVSNAVGVVTSQVAVLTVSPRPPCAAVPAGLVAWWPMDGSGQDWFGRNALAPVGGAAFAGGWIDQALQLDGMNDYAKANASPDLDVGLGDGLTVEAWIKPANAGLMGTLLEWNNGAGSIGAHFCVSVPSTVSGAGSLFANLVDTAGVSHQIGSAPGLLRANRYQHVALTYDKASGEAALYLDGSPVAQTNLGVFTPQTSFDLYVGLRPSGHIAGTYFWGAMDEVSVYGRALAVGEVAAIHAAAMAGKCRSAMPPEIVAQPQDLAVFAGDTATFRVLASGTAPLDYQWLFNGAELSGATQSTLLLSRVQPDQAGRYSVRVRNSAGTVTSTEATLTVEQNTSPPVITRQPFSRNVEPGSTLVFSVVATGAPPLFYQWQFNELPLPAATNSVLSIPNAQAAHAGSYSVVVSNDYGFAVSDEAILTVTNAFVGGTIHFANRAGSVDAPVFDGDGITKLSGPDYRAQLLAGPTLATMAVIGPGAAFVIPGYFSGGTRTLPTVSAGQSAYVQVRVWDQSRGLTYELALTNGAKHGASSVFTVVTGGGGIPPALPATLAGLTSFALTNLAMSAPLPLVLAPGGRAEDGSLEWVLRGPAGARCVIERSTDLVEWTRFGLIQVASGVARFTDPAGASQSYYRARLAD